MLGVLSSRASTSRCRLRLIVEDRNEMKRSSFLLSIIALFAYAVLTVSCIGFIFHTEVLVGSDLCHKVGIPKVWHYPTSRDNSVSETFYRKIDFPEPALCIAKQTAFTEEISKEKACFSQLKPGGFLITDEQWAAGKEVQRERWETAKKVIPAGLWSGFTDEGFSYQGKPFRRAGKYWVAMANLSLLPSPSGKFVVLQSVDNDNTRDFILFRQSGREPGNTRVYIQVFELATAKEVIRIRVQVRNISADTVYAATGWLDGDQLLVNAPRAEELHSCYLGDS